MFTSLSCLSAPVSSAVIPVLRKALWRPLQTRLLSADGPLESGLHQEILAQLVPFARAKDLHVLMDRLPRLLQTPGGHKRYEGSDCLMTRPVSASLFPVVVIKQWKLLHCCCAVVENAVPPRTLLPSWLEQVHLHKWVVLIRLEPWLSTRGDFAHSREHLATPDIFYSHDMGMGACCFWLLEGGGQGCC